MLFRLVLVAIENITISINFGQNLAKKRTNYAILLNYYKIQTGRKQSNKPVNNRWIVPKVISN